MIIHGLKILEKFKDNHTDIKSNLQSWVKVVEGNDWLTPNDIKERFPSASFLKDNVVVFNIKGNNYRLVAKINYMAYSVIIKKFGTHAEYSKWILE